MFVIRELYTQQSRNQIKNINITHFVRNSHDAPQGCPWGFAPQPSRVVGFRFRLALLQARINQNAVKLTEYFQLVALQVKLFFDGCISRASFDRVDAFGFELQGACQHQEAISGDCFWCVECHILHFVNVDAISYAIVKSFCDVFCCFQEVGRVTFLQWMFDVQCQAGFAAWQGELGCADHLAVASVNSNLAVDRVADVGGGERWVQCQFHCLGKIPHPLRHAMAKSIFNQKK